MNKFWMVLRNGSGYTSKRHSTKEAAIKEAERLAGKEGAESKFFILEATDLISHVETRVVTKAETLDEPEPEEEIKYCPCCGKAGLIENHDGLTLCLYCLWTEYKGE